MDEVCRHGGMWCGCMCDEGTASGRNARGCSVRDVDMDKSSGDETQPQGQAPRYSMECDQDKGAADVMEAALVGPEL